jgi:hypothetical protein
VNGKLRPLVLASAFPVAFGELLHLERESSARIFQLFAFQRHLTSRCDACQIARQDINFLIASISYTQSIPV